jgi:DNA-binding NtrC family response regulator
MHEKPSLMARRVVVVEDEPTVKAVVEATLSDAGAIIVSSFDQRLDAAVLDVRIGYGVTSLPIALVLELRRIPFLFYTAHSDVVTAPIQRRWPNCKILPKPIPGNILIDAVASLFEPHGHPAVA